MAQVLAPIIQTSGPITMLHSSSDAFQNPPTQQQPHHQQARGSPMPRSQQMYNGQGGGYRGTSGPVAPYAFSSTPQLRQENRSTSAPNPQALQQVNPARLGHPSHPSSSSDSTVSTSGSSSRSMAGPQFASKDDSVIGSSESRKSTVDNFPAITLSTSVPDLSFSLHDAPVKPSPDRYRRNARRTDSSNSGTASSSTPTPTQQSPLIGASATAGASKLGNFPALAVSDLQAAPRSGHGRASSVDDMQIPRQGSMDPAKRYRRRSLSGLEVNALADKPAPIDTVSTVPVTPSTKRPTQELRQPSSSSRHGSRPSSSQGHHRNSSAGSTSSTASNRPSSRQESAPLRTSPVNPPASSSRGAPEPARRVMAPSPLSHPITPAGPQSPPKKGPESTAAAASPAMQHLSALNDKDANRGMKSRLRRAFSFGSAAELRRASAENNLSAGRAKLRKDRYQNEQNELDAEQAAIVAKQEAAGIGAGIYSGQGGFSGSTDNLSISSTASSASIMLRKMGTGMKKGGRSIKGLFRPKSVIGVPAADGPVLQPSVGQVSMVTVEAERQKVNVNVDPHDQTGGGTGYPRLERNSLDAGRTTTDVNGPPNPSMNESLPRKSIVGGDRERAEVLSSIKKGILKRKGTNSGSSSPVSRPADLAQPNETPKSSASSTPKDDHARQLQVHVNGDDYFGRPPRMITGITRSLPSTPNGGPRNISFSPRIQFHDAWSSTDYDRRGDIATCNRLTPMLAQQIKEELNTFKMEMEVHELSKPHTHFF